MSVNLAYCRDCNAFDYAAQDNNGSFTFTPQASWHHGHDTQPVGDATSYPQPILMGLLKLQTQHRLTDNDIVMLRLGINLHGLDPSKPEPANDADQPDLFGGVA